MPRVLRLRFGPVATFGDILVTTVRYEQRCAKVRQQPGC